MANLAIFDVNTNAVIQYLTSVSSPDYAGRSDVLIGPDVSAVAGLPLRYWKHSAGSLIAMTSQEQASVDAALASAALASAKSSATGTIDSLDGISLRAIADMVISEINILRQRDVDRSADVAAAVSLADLKTRWAARSALNDRTLTQARNAYKNSISNGNVDQ